MSKELSELLKPNLQVVEADHIRDVVANSWSKRDEAGCEVGCPRSIYFVNLLCNAFETERLSHRKTYIELEELRKQIEK